MLPRTLERRRFHARCDRCTKMRRGYLARASKRKARRKVKAALATGSQNSSASGKENASHSTAASSPSGASAASSAVDFEAATFADDDILQKLKVQPVAILQRTFVD